ncbi:MAG: 4-hydroxythreonine-4-phosphate dehydrogenase PdxA [Bacteroidales bacterium]|nr:4-hydroxythreonine-4-phosphate dehydrogenase PdxA [Bacteroidales bacterium]
MKRIKVGITHGDINGIGYEIILNTLSDPRILDMCIPVIYGSAKVAAYYKKVLNLNNVAINSVRTIDEIHPKRNNLINCVDDNVKVELGKATTIAGESAFIALEQAISDLKAGKIDVLVTAPINKYDIQSDKFPYKGHTDYLQAKFEASDVVMFMVSEVMRVGLVCEHVPLSQVTKYITQERILSKLKIIQETLLVDFTVTNPKIAVLGLNPHAGDNGLLGNEEKEIIIPAIEAAQQMNIFAFGPFAADGFFGSGQFKQFDAILAMYHDQGLAPFKALTAGQGVNYTAGLPIIRTSPAHGTAYDIAGKGVASCDSFRNALYMACDAYRSRTTYKELAANKLKPLSASLDLTSESEIEE